MIATPQTESRAVSQQPSSEGVCLVDDDPMVLRSIGRLLGSSGFAVEPFNKAQLSLTIVPHRMFRSSCLPLWLKKLPALKLRPGFSPYCRSLMCFLFTNT